MAKFVEFETRSNVKIWINDDYVVGIQAQGPQEETILHLLGEVQGNKQLIVKGKPADVAKRFLERKPL